MKINLTTIFILSCFMLMQLSCDKDPIEQPDSQHETTALTLSYPAHFPRVIMPEYNPLTVEGVKLGKRLYYDPQLSKNGPLNGLSCASCHLQNRSFSNNANGTAVIPHVNMAWRTNFLWHGTIEGDLEQIMMFEVQDFFQADMDVLRNDSVYPSLFSEAFGTNEVTHERTAYALAQFFRTLISGNSKYDRYLRRELPLTYSERKGLTIFESERGDCFHCHSLPLSLDNSFHNIGLDSVFQGDSKGRFLYTNDSSDIGKFMTPTLRNIALTAPYMHDGRYSNLREVVEHYNSGVKDNEYLDPIMRKNGADGLNLSESEINHLIDFLNTLTDTSFLSNPDLASPF